MIWSTSSGLMHWRTPSITPDIAFLNASRVASDIGSNWPS
jgi:hypothetical protein